MKSYNIVNNVLKFNDDVTVYRGYLKIPSTVTDIDFNNLRFFMKPLRIEHTKITFLDTKKVYYIHSIIANNINIKENLYYVHFIKGVNKYESTRMKYTGIYDNKPLIYLSASVRGKLDIRTKERQQLLNLGFAVYSPGNHMTFGDEFAEAYPDLVGDIDVMFMIKSKIILFNLETLTPGTSSELGYVIGKKLYQHKKCYYYNLNTENFFINGLVKNITKINNFDDL